VVLRNAFFVLYACTLVAGVGGGLAENVVTHRVDQIAGRLEPLAQANAQVLQDLTDAETGLRGYEQTHQKPFLQPYYEGLRSLPSALAAARSLAKEDPLDERLIGEEAAAAKRWLAAFAFPALATSGTNVAGGAPRSVPSAVGPLARRAGRPKAGTAPSPTTGKALFDALRRANAAVGERVDQEVAAAEAASHRDERSAYLVFGALVVSTVAVGTVLGLRALRQTVPPLQRAAAALAQMTEGKGSVRVEVAGIAEARLLARAVNTLAEEYERRERRERDQERLRALRTELGKEHLDLRRLLNRVVSVLGTTFEADRVFLRWVGSLDGTGDVASVPFGEVVAEWARAGYAPASHLGEPPPALVEVLGGFPADGCCHDASSAVAALARENSVVAQFLSALGARSYLVCPLVLDGEVLGRISLVSGRLPGAWTADAMTSVELAAADVARALYRVRLYEDQRKLVAELEAADHLKSQLLSNVSHELRTPLTAVRGYVEMLLDGEAGTLGGEAEAMLRVVARNASRLQGLIDNLLTVSRISAGTFSVAKVPVGVGQIVRSVAADLGPVAAQRGVVLEVRDESGAATVLGDSEALARALINLVSNAIKFSRPGGRVLLGATRRSVEAAPGSTPGAGARDAQGEVSLFVQDEGIGIPAEELAQVGERFFRASNATAAVVPGTGLGLSIVRAVVDALGGTFSLASSEGAGTTATISLDVCGQEQAKVPDLTAT